MCRQDAISARFLSPATVLVQLSREEGLHFYRNVGCPEVDQAYLPLELVWRGGWSHQTDRHSSCPGEAVDTGSAQTRKEYCRHRGCEQMAPELYNQRCTNPLCPRCSLQEGALVGNILLSYFYFGPCELLWTPTQNAELIQSREHSEEHSTCPQNDIVVGAVPTMMLASWPRCSLV